MIHVYFYENCEARDKNVKEGGTLLGIASDPEELHKIINRMPEGHTLNYFSGEKAMSLYEAMIELGAWWNDLVEDFVWKGREF